MFGRSQDLAPVRMLGYVSAAVLAGGIASGPLAEPVTSTEAPIVTAQTGGGSDQIRALYRVRRLTPLRAEPRFDVQSHDSLSPGQQILVTGKVKDSQWCRIETRDGLEGFVIGSLIRPDEGAKPIDLTLWPKLDGGAVALEPVPPLDVSDIDPGALTAATKGQIQEALIYLGNYNGVIDGQLGERTFKAIRDFQQARGEDPSGQLTFVQYRDLMHDANDLRSLYAVQTFRNAEVGYRLAYPSRLFPVLEQVSDDAWRLSDEAGQAEILITAGPADADLQSLYERLNVPGKTSYSLLRERLLVVAGDDGSTRFYHVAKVGTDHLVQVRLAYTGAELWPWDNFAAVLFNSFDIEVE